MLLKVKGIGKIQDSTVEMKGITVIAGANNTGKSTYGKILYCMFNAFCNKEKAIRDERIDYICRTIRNISQAGVNPYIADKLSRILVNEMENKNTRGEDISENDIKNIINSFMSKTSSFTDEDENINDMVKNIKHSISINDCEMQKIIVDHYFQNEFERHINHVNKPQSMGNVSLIIKEKNLDITIRNNRCTKFIDDVGICHKAIYIDTPFVMNDISRYYRRSFPSFFYINYILRTNHMENLISQLGKDYSSNNVIEEVVINQKIKDILSTIHQVANGEFRDSKEDLTFIENGFKKPIPLSSISAGMKTFLIIKRLLELGEIKERDILILDEPEIHLHPEWQLQFAELLVLLQKEFNLTVLLTTHSPYFLNAIEVYGEKHGVKKNMNFYLTKNKEDYSVVEDVTKETDKIYTLMEEPFGELEMLRCEEI